MSFTTMKDKIITITYFYVLFLLNLNFRSLLCHKIFNLHDLGNINEINEHQ